MQILKFTYPKKICKLNLILNINTNNQNINVMKLKVNAGFTSEFIIVLKGILSL